MRYTEEEIHSIEKHESGYKLTMKAGINGYRLCEASWMEVPRYNKDKTPKTPEQFKREQIAANGATHFQQNFGNEFLGSSSTLITGTALKMIKPLEDEEIIFDSLFEGLRIFEEPKADRHYILTADPKQDGIDRIGLHVIDVTAIPFKQVASANLNDSFIIIPSRIFDLGTYYNNAYVVQENNTEATLINILVDQYEYEGEVFIERDKKGKYKRNIKGIRTTVKTKAIMTSFLKKFLEENMMIINDKHTMDELFNFIEKSNGSYSAEEGYTDDLVMSLMLVFAPFLDIKAWDDFKGFADLMHRNAELREQEEQETMDFLNLGFSSTSSSKKSTGFTEDLWGNSRPQYNGPTHSPQQEYGGYKVF